MNLKSLSTFGPGGELAFCGHEGFVVQLVVSGPS